MPSAPDPCDLFSGLTVPANDPQTGEPTIQPGRDPAETVSGPAKLAYARRWPLPTGPAVTAGR